MHTLSMLICLLTQYKYVMVDLSYIPNIVSNIAMLLILEYSYLYIEPDRDRLEGKFPLKQQYYALHYVENCPILGPYQLELKCIFNVLVITTESSNMYTW